MSKRRRSHHVIREQTASEQRAALQDGTKWIWPAECPRCEKLFAPASIVVIAATRDEVTESLGFPAQEIMYYCDHCSHLVKAIVTIPDPNSRDRIHRGDTIYLSRRDNAPRVVSPVLMERSAKKIDAFLERHPEARGVVAA